MSSIAHKLAVNTGVQLLGKGLSTVLGVFIVGLLTRYLGQEGFGVYTAANAFLQIFALILDLGINVTFIALLGEHADDKTYERRCVSALFTFRILMAIGILALAPLIWFGIYPQEKTLFFAIVALTGSVFFPSVNQIIIGVEQRQLKMHLAAASEVVGRVILLGTLMYARSQGWGLVSLVWLVSLGSLASFAANFFLMRSTGYFRWSWDPIFWKETLTRSWPVGLSIAFNLVYFKADSFILSRVRSLAEVGVYGAAYRVLEILITVPFMYAGVLLPILSEYWAKKHTKEFSDLISRSLELMFILICPMIVGTHLLGPRIMATVAGAEFAESGEILKILVLAVGIIYLTTITSHAIVALDAQRKMLPVYLTAAVLTLGGYLFFIPRYGMWAAAWLTVASECMVFLGSFLVTYQASPFLPRWRTLAGTVLASGIMGIIVWSLRSTTLIIPVLLGAVSYGILIVALGAVSKDVIQDILRIKRAR